MSTHPDPTSPEYREEDQRAAELMAEEHIKINVDIPEPKAPETCAAHGGVLGWYRVWGCEECYEPPTCSAEALIEKIDKEFVAVGRGRIDWNMYSTVPERTAMFRLKELIRAFAAKTGEPK